MARPLGIPDVSCLRHFASPRLTRAGAWPGSSTGLRYGGGIGQWSWLAHRLSGLGILFFLVVHITDTFFVVFAPDWYDHTVAIYGGIWFDGNYYWPLRWAFRVAELGLIASVVFHAVNGVGVILYDLWPAGLALPQADPLDGPGRLLGDHAGDHADRALSAPQGPRARRPTSPTDGRPGRPSRPSRRAPLDRASTPSAGLARPWPRDRWGGGSSRAAATSCSCGTS